MRLVLTAVVVESRRPAEVAAGWTPYHGGLLADPAAVDLMWLEEFESVRKDHRVVTYTMHPEAIGRGYLLRMLRRVIIGMLSGGRP